MFLKNKSAYTFLELMITISILSIGVVGIYKVLITSLDYQKQLSCRLFASNLLEHEIAVLENQFYATGEVFSSENGKKVAVVLNRSNVFFEISLSQAVVENAISGLLPLTVTVSWPLYDRTMHIKRDIYLVNLNIKPVSDATNPIVQ